MSKPKQKSAARTRDAVAILGFTEHNYQAPWKNPDWDFWGLNDLHSVLPRHWPEVFTSGQVQWFQLHRRGPDGNYPGARDPEHMKWLSEQKFPIWMWEHDPTIPESRPYPMTEILTLKHPVTGDELFPEKYFNNSISWMIAKAIYDGYKTIGLYGVDMAMDGVHGQSEYQHQRPSVENMIGVARGLGIKVIIPRDSEILKCGYLYGWDNVSHLRGKLQTRHEGLVAGEAESTDVYETTKRAMFQIKGALQLLTGECGEALAPLKNYIPAPELTKAIEMLKNDEQLMTNENEAAKRSLHEVRGAKHNLEWMLKNYLPGDGPIQDVPRWDGSITLPVPSDGHPPVEVPVNRLKTILME